MKASRTMFLVGVFTTETVSKAPPPLPSDFPTPRLNNEKPTLIPQLNQIFFIGNGYDDFHDTQQFFYPPPGATRLFLGFVDGKDNQVGFYDDNVGQLTVEFELYRSVQDTVSLDLEQGLIAYYPFDGDLTDSRGSYHGQLNPLKPDKLPTSEQFITGKYKQAVMLENRDIEVNISWFGEHWSISTWFVHQNKQNNCFGAFKIYSFDNSFSEFSSRITIGKWHHAMMVSSLGQTSYYIDGHLVTYKNWQSRQNLKRSYPSITSCDNLLVLDDFRVYNRALSYAEVKALAETDLNQQPQILVEYNLPRKSSLPMLGMVNSEKETEEHAIESSMFAGGFMRHEQLLFQKQGIVYFFDIVEVAGEILIDSADVGQIGDIFVYGELVLPGSEKRYFMLTEQGQKILLWDQDVASLVPFKHNIILGDYQRIAIYQGSFDFQGVVKVFLAYRFADGSIVTSPESIDINIFKQMITGNITKVSVNSQGEKTFGNSYNPAISADGRYVAFQSNASNLVENDTNKSADIFVHDRLTQKTTRISVDSNGVQGNHYSMAPSISANGRYVAFQSTASNLVENDTNDSSDVFVHDRLTQETTRVSVNSNGVQGNYDSMLPSISADGHYVTFHSRASNLVANDTNQAMDAFVYDRLVKKTSRVSITSTGEQIDIGVQDNPLISANARYVVFSSVANNLVQGDFNTDVDVFIHDRLTKDTTMIPFDDRLNRNDSYRYSISADGRYVVFCSVNEPWFSVYDSLTKETSSVLINDQLNRYFVNPSISADGRYVAFMIFESYDSYMIAIYDRLTKETAISVELFDNNALVTMLITTGLTISADGRYIAFVSRDGIGSDNTSKNLDVFVYDWRLRSK